MPNVGSKRVARLLPDSFIATRGERASRTLYLTFDDGPVDGTSQRVAEVLARHGVCASFFCIGEHLRRSADVAQTLLAGGHLLCNHSDRHRNYRKLDTISQDEDINACQQSINGLQPDSPRIFRAPRGQLDLRSALRLRRRGWRIVHWSYDSLDYSRPALSSIIERFEAKPVRPGEIILFHDDSELCAQALDRLIPAWKLDGFSFATVAGL